MTRRIVTNASPLIHLARLGLLRRLPDLGGVVLVPMSVHREVVVHGKALDAPDALAIERAFEKGWLRKARDVRAPSGLPPSLGAGERAAIALALSERCTVLLDDRPGYNIAVALGLHARRTTALLLDGVARGLWDAAKYEEMLGDLSEQGYFMTAKAYRELVLRAKTIQRRLR